MPEGQVEILEEIGKFRVLCHLQCCCWWLCLWWFMIVMMMILLIRRMTRCHLVISWLGSSIISAVVVQQALLYEVTVKKKRLFFPKLNHLLFLSFLQGAQNLEYHGACRLAEFPRPHGGEIQKKYGGGAEKYTLQTIAHKKMKNSAISGSSRPGLFRGSGTQLSAWICRKGGRLSKYFENFQPSGENFREKNVNIV